MRRHMGSLARLARSAFAVLIYEGPRHLAERQWLWLRKRWYYAQSTGASHTTAADLGRWRHSSAASHWPAARPSAPPPGDRRLRVVYVAAVEEVLSKRYRVDNILAQLRQAEVIADAVWDIDVRRHRDRLLRANVVVLQRIPGRPELFDLVEQLHEHGVTVAYEADDYIFEPTVVAYLRALQEDGSPQRIAAHQHYVMDCRRLLLHCGHFIGSTDFLVARARELGCTGFVIENGLNDRQVALAVRALASRRRKQTADGTIRIGYLSGTATHRQDFAIAVPALVRVLRERPQVRLMIRGPLDLPPELEPFRRQVERRPFVSWERLIAATASLHIVLAPLESDNPINEAKSALKYFESALVGVPTIASPIGDLRRAIHHDVNGICATTSEEWYRAVIRLVDDHERRRELGHAARQDALAHYTPRAQSANTHAVFQALVSANIGGAQQALQS